MIVKKILETRLDIKDINFIFCQNYNERIISELKTKYVGVCYKSIFVLEILRVIRKSDMYCKNKILDGSTYMDVTFEVKGIVYEKGEILHNCKILQINTNGTMHAKGKHSSIYVKNIEGMNIFKVGEEIPLIVNMCRYNIYETEISVSAIPLVPIVKKSVIYNITGDATKDLRYAIESKFPFNDLQMLVKNTNKHKKDNKAIYKFFHNLIYPYKKDIAKIGKETKITLDNLLANQDMIYSPDTRLDDDTYQILSNKDVDELRKTDSGIATINIDMENYVLMVLYEHLKKMQILSDFITTYDSTEKIKSKSSIWSLYDMLKV